MSILKTIPQDSRFIQTLNIFTGTFNVPTLGVYDFGVAANRNQIVQHMTRSSVYMINTYSISATTAEGVFLEAINTTPLVQLFLRVNRHPVYKKPLPMANYVDGNTAIAYYNSPQHEDDLIVSFSGILNQPAALVGVATVLVQLTMNIFEIIDSVWIEQYNSRTHREEFEI